VVVIQPREWIGFLPGEGFGRAQRADGIARRAVGGVELLAGDGAGGQAGQEAALGIGQVACQAITTEFVMSAIS